jgi:phenylacetic acid degradation operon negative regulatory protein
VSPWHRPDLPRTVERAGGRLRTAIAETFDVDPVGAWDLPALSASYDAWVRAADRLVEAELGSHGDEDEAMFAARFHLVHEWRKFLFTDPGLPAALLPEPWPGREAEELFHDEATRLEPGATRFVTRCLAG